jgi:hypothetical protein
MKRLFWAPGRDIDDLRRPNAFPLRGHDEFPLQTRAAPAAPFHPSPRNA